MKKIIVVAISEGYTDGWGDYFFAVKVAAGIQRHVMKVPATPVAEQAVCVRIVCSLSIQMMLQNIIEEMAVDLIVWTVTELKDGLAQTTMEVLQLIEGPVFVDSLIQEIYAVLPETAFTIPLMMIPEYGFSEDTLEIQQVYQRRRLRVIDPLPIQTLQPFFRHIHHQQTLYTGFSPIAEGVLLDQVLHFLTKSDELLALDHDVQQVISTINARGLLTESIEFSMQYSHDSTYIAPYEHERYWSMPQAYIWASLHFTYLHAAYIAQRTCHQVVFMMGELEARKHSALLEIKRQLIADQFTYIAFHNAKTQQSTLIYERVDAAPPLRKEYHVIYSPKMSHPSMMACMALSGPFVGATGDQSFCEALVHNKCVIYELRPHKRNLIRGYDEAIIVAAEHSAHIQRLFILLRSTHNSLDDYKELSGLLKTHYDALVECNQRVLWKKDLVDAIIQHRCPQVANSVTAGLCFFSPKKASVLESSRSGHSLTNDAVPRLEPIEVEPLISVPVRIA